MIKYNGLFAILAIKGMKKTDLLEVISSPTLAKLSKGETVQTDVIDRLCEFLQCQPANIMCAEFEAEGVDRTDGKLKRYTYQPEFNYNTRKSEHEIINIIDVVE